MADSETKQAIRRLVEAINGGDEQAIADSFAEDATWRLGGDIPGVSGFHDGRREILENFFANAGQLFEPGAEMRIEVKTMTAEDDRVSVEWEASTRAKNGEPYVNQYNLMFEVREGVIQAVREYNDTLYARRVLLASE